MVAEVNNGLSSTVKWMDGLSLPFKIKRGVWQEGILSTHIYNIFVQDLFI